jgi:hypothetical protein
MIMSASTPGMGYTGRLKCSISGHHHLGALDAASGVRIKNPVKGRRIDV